MIFRHCAPSLQLQPYVQFMIYHEGFVASYAREKILPDGQVELIIDLTESPKRLWDNDDFRQWIDYRRAWISGLRSRYITIDSAQQSAMLVVRFQPGGAHALFGVPMHELADRVEEVESIWGARWRLLRDELQHCRTPNARFATTDRFLRAEIASARHNGFNPYVQHALTRIHADPGRVTVADLACELGYSRKHVASLFRRHVGTTPKAYARLIRFQRMVKTLSRPGAPGWAQAAEDLGYYDQAHLANEFRAMAGSTLTEWLRAQDPVDPFYVPVE